MQVKRSMSLNRMNIVMLALSGAEEAHEAARAGGD